MAVTPEMIASFVKVFEPEPNLSGQLKYSVQLLIDKSDKKGVAALEAMVAKAKAKGVATKWGGKEPAFRYQPLRDGDAELASGEKEDAAYKGRMFLNASANEKDKPQVVGPDAKPLMDQDLLYSGAVVRADLSAFPYKNSGNSGVGWYLNSLMVVRDGERLDGRQNAVDAFEKYAIEDEESDDNLA